VTWRALWLACGLLATGCAAMDPGAVRDLSAAERRAFAALDQRLRDNRPAMQDAVGTLGELGAEWTEQAFEAERNLARARRLESMQAPWAQTAGEYAQTQRAVVLYHLYEVEMAEQQVLEGRVAARRAAAEELLGAYDRYAGLLGEATGALEVVMEHLEQPDSARLAAAIATLLDETAAFREALQRSDNPRLQALAAEVARSEAAAMAVRQQADAAVQAMLRLQGALQ
jgi:hypothetical protein